MHKTRQQLLASLGDLMFAEAPGAAGEGGGSSTDESSTDDANVGQTSAQSGQSDDDDDESDDTGSKADDPKLRAARDEAYQNRVKARDAEQAATTAAQEKDALIQQIGKALGLVKDDDGESEAPDADALAQSVAAEQAKATDAHRELAVYKAAGKAGADPEKLLDSRRFIDSIAELDPTDADAVATAVKDALASHPNLAQRRERGASTADTASGPGGGSAPKAEVPLLDALGNRYGTK